jgi:O-antigen/teichoic acid export membrane protein
MIVPYYSSWATGHGAPNAIAQLLNGILVVVTAILLIPRLGAIGVSIAQLWVCGIFLWHTLWVNRIISPQSRILSWLPAYVSPIALILIWFGAVQLILQYMPSVLQMPAPYIGLVSAGGLISLAFVWLLETKVFHGYERWQTLTRAYMLVLTKMTKLRTSK